MARTPMEFTQAPMRTVRPKDLAGVFAYPRVQIARLVEQGAAVRLAHGYAVAVPDDQGPGWKPTIEEAAAGIAATIFGQRQVVLMGITAARIHQAIPRALGNAVVAVPHQHRPIALAGGGSVLFVTRATERLDARLETLETGRVLVTTPEQTLLDLAKRPTLGDAPDEARAAVVNLLARVDRAKIERLARAQRALTVWHEIERV